MPRRYVACILSAAGMMATCIANHCYRVALEQMVFPIYESQPFEPELLRPGYTNEMDPPSEYVSIQLVYIRFILGGRCFHKTKILT